ncbi:MAG: hypothetical protein ABF481_10845 [Liquorilactobacillus satsumensis]|uniref:AbrB/MazE/SpoVT family DNA-binding domain-containing protein n=1 Tax=Lactobacillaceae TaxID=33958 RepID=UPI001CC1FAD5|nr:hypothetical protein [Lentilactobacillus hilgardii]MBZ2205582.1 hypothetical protein [Lentilactobacillus hilgardii]MCT3397877.1 hypothetical protein [Lentilactobacillus hilgardii]
MTTTKRTIGRFKVRKAGNSMVITVPKSLAIREGEMFVLNVDASATQLVYEKADQTNPWENGQFKTFNFRQNMQEVGNYGQGHDVGKEQVTW